MSKKHRYHIHEQKTFRLLIRSINYIFSNLTLNSIAKLSTLQATNNHSQFYAIFLNTDLNVYMICKIKNLITHVTTTSF